MLLRGLKQRALRLQFSHDLCHIILLHGLLLSRLLDPLFQRRLLLGSAIDNNWVVSVGRRLWRRVPSLLNVVLEVLEGYEHNREVVQRMGLGS